MSANDEVMLHEPDLSAVPNKPALVTAKSKKKKKKVISLTWDEHAIEEHDQLRGTRMKIDEPDTPFAYHSDSEASANSHQSREKGPKQLNWTHLETKLGAVVAAREACPSSPSLSSHGGNSSGVDSDFELEKRRKKDKAKEFGMHRKTHYNEMEALRNWRLEHQNDEDEDDDDEH